MSTDTLWVYTVSYTVHGWNCAVREQRAATMTTGAATGAATMRQPVRQQYHVRCNVSYDSSCNNYATTVTVNDATSSTTTGAAFCTTTNTTSSSTFRTTSTTLLSSPMLTRRRQRCECLRCSVRLLLYAPVDHVTCAAAVCGA